MDNIEDTGATVLVHPTVLVVDDADENLMIIESILAKEYSLKLFNNAKDALDEAFANPPDLILLDVMMPDIDGFEACRRLKANPKLVDIPVIFITAFNDLKAMRAAKSIGIADYLTKPFDLDDLVSRIQKFLN